MSKESFENWRWDSHSQTLQEKHKMAWKLYLNLPTSNSVLSVGEGDGFFLNTLQNVRRVGIDFSDVAIKKMQGKGIEAYKLDIEREKLPFKDKEFDVVFLIDVLEHVWLPDVLLKEASRVGKHVIVTVPNFAFLKDRLQLLFGRVPMSMGDRKGHCFFFTYNKLKETIDKAGLKIKKVEHYFPLNNWFTKFIGWFIGHRLFSTMFAVLLEEK